MVRSFAATPIPADLLDRVLRAGLRAPSAGNTQGTDLVVLAGGETNRYWDVTLPAERRDDFAWPGLLLAPVLIVVIASPKAYAERYSEADKAGSGLGRVDRWLVPYWYIDAAFVAMLIQLAAINEGLGALFFGIFDHVQALRRELGVPSDREPIGTIALGHPSGPDRPSRSSKRPRRRFDEVVHRGEW
jgi:nitroreductase